MLDLGVPPLARIPLVCGLGEHFFDALFACGLIGAVPVPVNTWLEEGELAGVLDDCGAPIVLCDKDQSARLAGVLTQKIWTFGEDPPECVFGDDLTLGAGPTDALQLYTSGTTGKAERGRAFVDEL